MVARAQVLAIIATPVLGGPGKGLLQFARHASADTRVLLGNFSCRGQVSELCHRAREQGVAVELLHQRGPFDPRPLAQALQLVRKQGINIVQSHGYKSHLVARYVAARAGLPWLAFAHGWTDESRRARLYNRLEKWLLRQAPVAVAVSRPLHDTLAQLRGRRPTELVLNAVDPRELRRAHGGAALRARLQVRSGQIVIGVFGRLSREKGHTHLLTALTGLGTDAARFRLVVVGQGPERAALQARAEQLGVASQVSFEGYRDNMGDYFEAVDLLALPSLSEGTPNVVLEALALGRPVLATRTGGVGDLVLPGVNGWLVDPGDSAALAAVLRHLLQAPGELAEFGARAPGSLARWFMADARAARIEALYERLLRGPVQGRTHRADGGMA